MTDEKSRSLLAQGDDAVVYDANGKVANPYIPKFISTAPWYNNATGQGEDYLAHQRLDPSKPAESYADSRPGQGIVDVVPSKKRALAEDNVVYKKVKVFPKDACTNCGSINHLRRECLEKPRKITAKSLLIVKEEHKEKLKNVSDWDSKRDRWNGYELAKEWENQVKHWQEKEKLILLKQELVQDETEMDEDELAELAELGIVPETTTVKPKIINIMDKPDKPALRSRDDKPVYLRNLGGEVTYNPKSRTDRSNELGYVDEHQQFVRHLNGELQEFELLKKFAWNQDQVGNLDSHIELSPTLAMLQMKQAQKTQLESRDKRKLELLLKYGDTKPLQHTTKTESTFSSYNSDGTVQKTSVLDNYDFSDIYNPKVSKKSKFDEDVYVNGHTAVWGSYWDQGKWGYKCCHSTDRDSTCKR